MTEPKKIATSLKRLLDSKLVLDILDKSTNIEAGSAFVKAFWDYDLGSRKPSQRMMSMEYFKEQTLIWPVFYSSCWAWCRYQYSSL